MTCIVVMLLFTSSIYMRGCGNHRHQIRPLSLLVVLLSENCGRDAIRSAFLGDHTLTKPFRRSE